MSIPELKRISARHNPDFKRFLAVRSRKDRDFVLLEGPKMLAEARESKLRIEILAIDGSKAARDLERETRGPCAVLHVTPALMREISDVETSQGIVALARRPIFARAWLSNPRGFVVIFDRIQDPGNVGTLIRSAEAAGASGVLLTEGCADPFSPKALRASAGSALRLPHVQDLSPRQALSCLPADTTVLLARATPGAVSVFEATFKMPLALALGSEGSGLDEEFEDAGSLELRIPHARTVESLNVAAAGSVLMFEIARRTGLLHLAASPSPDHARH